MGHKKQQPPSEVEELRAANREAHELLQDLRDTKRDIEKLIGNGIEEYLVATVKRAEKTIADKVSELMTLLRRQGDKCQEAILRRWAYIETMCLGDDEMARLIAVQVLKEAGGAVDTESATWHLVKEVPDERGTVAFGFANSLAYRINDNPALQEKMRDAVAEFQPDAGFFEWSMKPPKGERER